ncbi:ABC transporter permease [Aquamicrobium sp. NLF2-7]|jgi:peptide/nickel transport system permease protein|uniref:Glutathione transport system permease protein GsiC n=1 Tax=Aquamicrobium lusatiense TaxID=89772 RepID=A0A7W9S0X4_9HYPH|nr:MULTISPECIES: ABC transporter permease [Aquamicrobium]MBB6011339.1 peptide/nickel transport system permease protein [Aquamicrobium lusatiense]MCG8272089.1 ABC transporter permease [Aquamicrobium sp. NLF2-7]MDH4991766.1 ABC transporter permease [Aquamicrobium lusatiense]
MLRFTIRRVLQIIPTIVVVALLIFVIFSVVPGSFATSLLSDGKTAPDPQLMARLNEQLGLDKPVHQRFITYVGDLAQLDLGTSFRTRRPVLELINERIWASLQLAVAAMIFAVVVAVPLGFLAALRPGSILDTVTMVGAVSGLSLPQFWLGLLLMYVFALQLNWLPSFGYGDGSLRNLILPAITLGVTPLALLARTTRAGVLDVLNGDFVRTAHAKGLSEAQVVRRHVARNALVLIITTVGLLFGSLIGQAVVIEKLFAWPGIGSLLVDSVAMRDIPVVQGTILVIVVWFLVINTAVDIVYALVDPRIKQE